MLFRSNRALSTIRASPGGPNLLLVSGILAQDETFTRIQNTRFINNTGGFTAGIYFDSSSLAGFRNSYVSVTNSQ